MKYIKLSLIRLADWIDAHILDHRVYRVCHWIGVSSWWDFPPVSGGAIKYDPESDILNIRITNRKIEASQRIESDIIVDYDSEWDVVGLEILNFSTQLENALIRAGIVQGLHEARTGKTYPVEKLWDMVDTLGENDSEQGD